MPPVSLFSRSRGWLVAGALVLFASVLLLGGTGSASASADPPGRLAGQVTDRVQALDGAGRGRVQGAVDRLYESRRVRLWVVFVGDFGGLGAQTWSERTAALSGFGERDVLLAVATVDREYRLHSPGLPQEVSDAEFEELLVEGVEPALRRGEWGVAAVAAADGLDEAMGSAGRGPSAGGMLVIGGVALVAVVAFLLYSRKKRRERVRAGIEAARGVDPADTAALAGLPVEALELRSREVLVELDDALRTSAEELELARGEFGEVRTRPFTAAFDSAKAAVAHAFALRQRLDDGAPESAQVRRDLLVELIGSCGRADKELDAQVAEFDALRDLLIDAPRRLDALTEEMVGLTARLPGSRAALEALAGEFAASALAPVRDNVAMAEERLAFADKSITEGRAAAARPVGQQGPVVAAIRAAEGAIGQARALLDAVDHAGDDIRGAVAALPAALDEVRRGIAAAAGLSADGGPELAEARAVAEAALARAESTRDTDPLGALNAVASADADLDRAVAGAQARRQDAERLGHLLDQALGAAAAQVSLAEDFVTTRRGAVGAEARTRLAEARRHLAEAQRLRDEDLPEALRHAQAAADLGARAAAAAEEDVLEWEAMRAPQFGGTRYGGDAGAVLGGILLGGVLGGGFGPGRGAGWGGGGWGGGGGGGGWGGPGSFGGTTGSRRHGGGGRF